jgi:hypothetical protein
MRYRLRTLLILLAILPPMIWGGMALARWLHPPAPTARWHPITGRVIEP